MIDRIEEAQAVSDAKNIKYMDMIGYLNKQSTQLFPKTETFGASFFEWDQGNIWRVLFFLQTIGYDGLQVLPTDQFGQMARIADSMPIWPNVGSVKVVGDVVLIKFGPYSDSQKAAICRSAVNRAQIQVKSFCP